MSVPFQVTPDKTTINDDENCSCLQLANPLNAESLQFAGGNRKSSPKTAHLHLLFTPTRNGLTSFAPELKRNENCPSSFEISVRLARFDEKDGIQFPSQRPILLAATGSVRETSPHLQEKSFPICRNNLRHFARLKPRLARIAKIRDALKPSGLIQPNSICMLSAARQTSYRLNLRTAPIPTCGPHAPAGCPHAALTRKCAQLLT